MAKYSAIICLVLLCCASCTVPAAAQGSTTSPTRTFKFLQAFAKSFPQLTNIWTGTSYCSWDGVSCIDETAGTGVTIFLADRGLTGRLPDVPNGNGAISVLAIDLSNNTELGGTFRRSWSALTQLNGLYLFNTTLRGKIPDEWRDMAALSVVFISNTMACGSVPNWRSSSMPFLEYVDFSNNALTELSKDFGSFSTSSSLDSLKLDGNRFCSCLPNTWTSDLLRNAALSATPALGDSNCNTVNQCSQDERRRCQREGVSHPLSGASLAFMLACAVLVLLS